MRAAYLIFAIVFLNGFFIGTCPAHAQSATVPTVFYSSQPVFANETVLAATGNTDLLSAVSIVRLPDTNQGSPLLPLPPLPAMSSTQVLQSSPTAVKFLVPTTFEPGVYAYKIRNSRGQTSSYNLLNAPSIMFIQGDGGDYATPGGWLEVHGTAIGLQGNKTPELALVSGGTVVKYLTPVPTNIYNTPNNDMYRQRFVVPANVPTGTYEIYVHNGYGGPYGWTRFDTFVTAEVNTFTIANAPSWPQTVINVAAATGTSADDTSVANALAAAASGGIIQFPAGTYTLSQAITLPNHVVLQGAGQNSTILNWTTDPMSGGNYLPLISGQQLYYSNSLGYWVNATFCVENLSIVGSATYNGYAIQRSYTLVTEPATISNVSITLPLNGSTATTNAKGIWLRHTNDTTITNNTINARFGVYANDSVSNTLIENNVIQWREMTINLCGGCNNFIIDHNSFEMMGDVSTNNYSNNDNPGFWFRTAGNQFAYFSGAYLENVYYAFNTSSHDTPFTTTSVNGTSDGAIGITYDAGQGLYFGTVQSVETADGVTTVTLTNPTYTPLNPNTGLPVSGINYVGAVMKVESGTGAGQWAYMTNAVPNSTTVTINKPFAVPLDGTSIVSIVNMEGEVIFDSNYFGAEPNNQNYFFSMDVIKANNTYASAMTQSHPNYNAWGGDMSWAGSHYNMPFSDWHYQFLNNTIPSGDTGFEAFTTGIPAYSTTNADYVSNYTGPVAANFIYRNTNTTGSATAFILLRANNGLFTDSIVENNHVNYVGLGRPGEALNFNGIVLRRNTGASYNYGNLIGLNPNGVSGVKFLP